MKDKIILFDGVCNFCSQTVEFVIKRDPNKQFKFAHLQSPYAARELPKAGMDYHKDLTSMVLLDGEKAYAKSTAALHIAKQLKWPWPLLYGFIIVPSFIRNAVYDFIGNHRYKWFGIHDTCWIPPEEDRKSRFIEDGEAR